MFITMMTADAKQNNFPAFATSRTQCLCAVAVVYSSFHRPKQPVYALITDIKNYCIGVCYFYV
jgi:hypothetical protein